MKMKLTNKQIVEDPNVKHGLWVWVMPNGQVCTDENYNILNTIGYKGDTTAAFALAKTIRSFGITEGRPVFMEGQRRIDDEEYERQKFRMKMGLTPDPEDYGAIRDDLTNGII